jgi:hypothetical protein
MDPNHLVPQFVDRAPSSLGPIHCRDNFALQLKGQVVATKGSSAAGSLLLPAYYSSLGQLQDLPLPPFGTP